MSNKRAKLDISHFADILDAEIAEYKKGKPNGYVYECFNPAVEKVHPIIKTIETRIGYIIKCGSLFCFIIICMLVAITIKIFTH